MDKNNNNNMVNLVVDLSRGAYLARSENGKGYGICKPINGVDNSTYYKENYSRRLIKKRQQEIMDIYDLPKKIVKNIDTVLYKTLEDYDMANGTNYKIKYLNVMAKEIVRRPGEPKDMYLQRAGNIRALALEEAGISVEYNVFSNKISRSLSIIDIIKLRRMAKKQAKIFGKQNSKYQLLDDVQSDDENPYEELEYEDENVEVENDSYIIDGEKMLQDAMEKANLADELSKIDAEFVADRKEIVSQIMEEKKAKEAEVGQEVEIPDESNLEPVEEQKEEIKTEESKIEQEEQKSDTNKKNNNVKSKKSISRRKSIQASKKNYREASKNKNLYKQRIANREAKRVARLEREAQKGPITKADKTAEYKAKHTAPVKEEKVKQPKKEQVEVIVEKEQSENESVKNKVTGQVKLATAKVISKVKSVQAPNVTNGINTASTVVYKTVNKFTRKVKDETDSIKNKVYKHKNTIAKIAIVGAATAMIFAVAIMHENCDLNNVHTTATNSYQTEFNMANEDVSNEADETEIGVSIEESSVQDVVENETVGAQEIVDNAQKEVVEENKQEVTEDEEAVKEENEEEKGAETSDKDNYLDLVKVGTKMNIESGLFFETPEGTGKYGHFENHKGAAKIISKIGISTKDGYISIDDENISLRELKEKYPDGVFAYHFVDEDGHTLGWLTSESFSKTLDENEQDLDER